jgi:hypothetical protein
MERTYDDRAAVWGMQLIIRVDDMKPSRMTTLNDVTQQNILFIEKIKLI